jgi:insulysin
MGGTPIPDLHLPGKNPFIPERLDVEKFEVDEVGLCPTTRLEVKGCRC